MEPRWGYRADCTLPAMSEWTNGWLVVELHDYDRIGDDDPMVRHAAPEHPRTQTAA